MKQKFLIGSIVVSLTTCLYVWHTLFNLLDEKNIKNLLPALSASNDEYIDEQGWTPLMHAAYDGDVKKVSRHINDGANINYSDADGETPLYLATYMGHTDVVRELLNTEGIDTLNKTTKDNTSPLFIAAENGYKDIFTYLVEMGAELDIEQKDVANGNTMLHGAVRNGKYDMVEHLLELGFNPNARNNESQTPIMLIFGLVDTTSEDLIKMIEILVEGGADINSNDSKGVSLLLQAYYEGNEKVINFLVQLGAEGVIQTQQDAQEALELLEINSEQEYRHAIVMGKTGIVGIFLKAGYSPNIRDVDNDNTMLFQLVFSEELETMELLLNNGADPNIKNDSNGNTALWMAVSQNRPEIVELLLKFGAENIANNAGWTPLMVAEDDENNEIKILLDQYLTVKNDSNETKKEENENISQHNNDDINSSNSYNEEIYDDIPEVFVFLNNETIREFYTIEEAVEFAKNYQNVEVWVPNSTVWDNKPSRVYQNDQFVGDFDTKVQALEVAVNLQKAKVVNLLTGKVEWDSYPRECRTCESAIQDQY